MAKTLGWSVAVGSLADAKADALMVPVHPDLTPEAGAAEEAFQRAGQELTRACRRLGGCPVGGARVTPGYQLAARVLILVVGPRWRTGESGEAHQLALAYRAVLTLADQERAQRVLLIPMETGAYGYPRREVLVTAGAVLTAMASAFRSVQHVVCLGSDDAAAADWTAVLGARTGTIEGVPHG